jgi:Derlin-2/3
LKTQDSLRMAEILEEYKKIPLITRVYMTGCVLVTGACALELISPFQLYFSAPLIFRKFQFWRLFSNFFFFGSRFSLDYLFHLFFL